MARLNEFQHLTGPLIDRLREGDEDAFDDIERMMRRGPPKAAVEMVLAIFELLRDLGEDTEALFRSRFTPEQMAEFERIAAAGYN